MSRAEAAMYIGLICPIPAIVSSSMRAGKNRSHLSYVAIGGRIAGRVPIGVHSGVRQTIPGRSTSGHMSSVDGNQRVEMSGIQVRAC
jgi:hypothetical protein